ncbi:hypothetical protein, partial [Halorubrum ezzemoulense]|uniref:hypothetical protein n=1 Tax=Halorubrum ezzemoulense TaxID=337243 RepID=UPI001C52BBAD
PTQRTDLLVNYGPSEVEPPHPVCDMKSRGWREGVALERNHKTSEIGNFTVKKSQRQRYQDRLCTKETFT